MEQQEYDYQAKIYTLNDSNGIVFYVGCTILTVEERLMQHICEAKGYSGHPSPSPKCKAIQTFNYEISATIVDMVKVKGTTGKIAVKQAKELEVSWIRKFQEQGIKLYNRNNTTDRTKKEQYIGKIVKAA